MQDGDAEFAVRVDVWMVERMRELEFGRGVWVVVGELHVGEEVAAVVEGVWVDDYDGDGPVHDVFVLQLSIGKCVNYDTTVTWELLDDVDGAGLPRR